MHKRISKRTKMLLPCQKTWNWKSLYWKSNYYFREIFYNKFTKLVENLHTHRKKFWYRQKTKVPPNNLLHGLKKKYLQRLLIGLTWGGGERFMGYCKWIAERAFSVDKNPSGRIMLARRRAQLGSNLLPISKGQEHTNVEMPNTSNHI